VVGDVDDRKITAAGQERAQDEPCVYSAIQGRCSTCEVAAKDDRASQPLRRLLGQLRRDETALGVAPGDRPLWLPDGRLEEVQQQHVVELCVFEHPTRASE
jgi:hypothetical protein